MTYTVHLPQVVTGVTPPLLHYVNAERVAHGLQPLVPHSGLMTVAQQWADYMRDSGFWGHGDWGQRIIDVYQNWRIIGENIAGGHADAQAAVAGWMASDGHRANILNPMFEEAGTGYAEGGYYGRYYVMDFGARFT